MVPLLETSVNGPLYNGLGTFWTQVFRDPYAVRTLLRSTLRTNLLAVFNQAVQDMAGDWRRASLVRNVPIPFKPGDVVETGTLTYGDEDPPTTYAGSYDAEQVYGNKDTRFYALPLTEIVPLLIQGNGRRLVLGVDFFVSAGRFLYFKADPLQEFPAQNYLVLTGYNREYKSCISYFTQAHAPGYDDLLVKYYRTGETPGQLLHALGAVGRLGVVRVGGKLLASTGPWRPGQSVRYAFDSNEVVEVDYPHTPLELGRSYPPGLLGDPIVMLRDDGSGRAWWRGIDWRGGLSLAPLVPEAADFFAVDAWRPAYAAGQDAGSVDGSKVHARVKLSEDFWKEKRYWDKVSARETATGYYLNQVIGLPNLRQPSPYQQLLDEVAEYNALQQLQHEPLTPPDPTALPDGRLVNPLDVFFQGGLAQVGLVLAFYYSKLRRTHAIFEWLAKTMPTGCCPVIIGFLDPILDQAQVDLDAAATVVKATETTVTSLTDIPGLDGERTQVQTYKRTPEVVVRN